MFFFYLFDEIGISFSDYGIYPRSWQGILGIFFSPFLHGNGSHLLSNAMPLLILGTATYLFYPNSANTVLLWVYLGSGLGIWLFGRGTSHYGLPLVHIGSSGVIYGLAAFLVGSGVVRRQPKAVAISLSVYFLYSGMIGGLFPMQPGISWEGHLSGAFLGIWLAVSMRNKDKETGQISPSNRTLSQNSGFVALESKKWKYTFVEKPKK
jgi:membrane associated rhomboid family serine protease